MGKRARRRALVGEDVVVGDEHPRRDQKSGAEAPAAEIDARHGARRNGAPQEIGDRHKIVAAENTLVDLFDLFGPARVAQTFLEKLLPVALHLRRGDLVGPLVARLLDRLRYGGRRCRIDDRTIGSRQQGHDASAHVTKKWPMKSMSIYN